MGGGGAEGSIRYKIGRLEQWGNVKSARFCNLCVHE